MSFALSRHSLLHDTFCRADAIAFGDDLFVMNV